MIVQRRKHGRTVLLCTALVLFESGCAAVQTIQADGSQTFGIRLSTETVGAADRPQLVSATLFGVSSSAQGMTIGVRSENVLVAPAGCRAVFVITSALQAETAIKLADAVDQACIVKR